MEYAHARRSTVAGLGEGDRRGEHAIGIESRVNRHEGRKAPDEEARADEKDDCELDRRDYEGGLQAVADVSLDP